MSPTLTRRQLIIAGAAAGTAVRRAEGRLANRYPPGNNGRTTMGLTEHGPIPDNLADLLDR